MTWCVLEVISHTSSYRALSSGYGIGIYRHREAAAECGVLGWEICEIGYVQENADLFPGYRRCSWGSYTIAVSFELPTGLLAMSGVGPLPLTVDSLSVPLRSRDTDCGTCWESP